MKINSINYTNPAFKSNFTIDASTATSRQQLLVLGMMISDYWLDNAEETLNNIKSSGVYGKINITVNDYRDNEVEGMLKGNNISYHKTPSSHKFQKMG